MTMPFITTILSLASLPIALAATFEVHVGAEGGPGCSPALIEGVADGDVLNFIFHPGSNIVMQAASDNACNVLSGGFSSGTVHVPSGTTASSFFVVPFHQDQDQDQDQEQTQNSIHFSCGAPSNCWSRTTLTVTRDTQSDASNFKPKPPPANQPFRIQARADTPSGFTSIDLSTATLGSHNPTTFSGSIATPDTSARDGATGTATTGLHLSTTTRPPSGSATSPGVASGGAGNSNSVSGSGTPSASASGGNSTGGGGNSGAEAVYVGKSTLAGMLGAFVLGLGLLVL